MIANFGTGGIGLTNENIKSNREYWIPKIERRIKRDINVNRQLESAGWIVMRFWESAILANVQGCVDGVICRQPS